MKFFMLLLLMMMIINTFDQFFCTATTEVSIQVTLVSGFGTCGVHNKFSITMYKEQMIRHKLRLDAVWMLEVYRRQRISDQVLDKCQNSLYNL
jgi:hypothetical protein